jgi:hypothetical protein
VPEERDEAEAAAFADTGRSVEQRASDDDA